MAAVNTIAEAFLVPGDRVALSKEVGAKFLDQAMRSVINARVLATRHG